MSILRGVDYSFPGAAASVKPAGFDFATVESSIGMHDNASWQSNVLALKKAGVPCSGYHYCIFTNDPIAEADALVARVKRIEAAAGEPLDFAISADVEMPKSETDLSLPLPAAQIIAWLNVFLPRVRAGLGYYPVVYIYQAYLKMLDIPALATSELRNCLLWLADYDEGAFPTTPGTPRIFDPKNPLFVRNNPWKLAQLLFMQTKGNTTVPGIPHIVDTDVFFGTLADLKATRGGLLASLVPAPVAAAVDAVVSAASVPPPPNNLPAPISAPVASTVGGKAPLIAALLAALAGGAAWLLQHFFRR